MKPELWRRCSNDGPRLGYTGDRVVNDYWDGFVAAIRVPFDEAVERMARYRYSRQVMPVPSWDDLLPGERRGWLDTTTTMLLAALGEDAG